MRARIAILGGSSPFTAALIDAFVQAAAFMQPHDLLLHGRHTRNLQRVAQYGRHRLEGLGWHVYASIELAETVADADLVIHQVRYGGMEGRALDESLAMQFHVAPDETLGPAALHAILRTLPDLRKISAELVKSCPNAWVLNLTNPLSLVTALMSEVGIKRCVGLCELPLVTLRQAAEVLKLPSAEVEWAYAGLNHRGFIVKLRYAGIDHLGELASRLAPNTIGRVTAASIAQLRALPTKYFRLVSGDEKPQSGRAAFLSALRNQIAEELKQNPTSSPPGLRKRYLEWYPQAVVPMVAALLSPDPTLQIVNILTANGVVEECQAWVSKSSIELVPTPAVSEEVSRWLRIYRMHERSLLEAVRCPSLETIAQALRLDPMVSLAQPLPMARAIWKSSQRFVTATP